MKKSEKVITMKNYKNRSETFLQTFNLKMVSEIIHLSDEYALKDIFTHTT